MTTSTLRAMTRAFKASAVTTAALLAAPGIAHATPPAGYPTTPNFEVDFKGTTKHWGAGGPPANVWANHVWFATALGSCPTGLTGTCYDNGNGQHDVTSSALPTNPGGAAQLATAGNGGGAVTCPAGFTAPCYGGATLSLVSDAAAGVHGYFPTYGYWEARMQAAPGTGVLTSLYCISRDHMTGAGGSTAFELDVVEHDGQNANYDQTSVWSYAGGVQTGYSSTYNSGVDLSLAYHTYGMEYTATAITFYLDGTQVYTTATPSDGHVPVGCMIVQYANDYASGSSPIGKASHWDYVKHWDYTPQFTTPSSSISNATPAVNTSVTATVQFQDSISSTAKVEIRFIDPTGGYGHTCNATVTFVGGTPQTKTCVYTPTTVGAWNIEARVYDNSGNGDVFMAHDMAAAAFTTH